jgi:hypothetical protein
MELYERAAALASRIELHVDAHVVNDDATIDDYQGPHLVVIAHGGKLVTFSDVGRTVVELAAERMQQLLAIALAAEHELYTTASDTAVARPITSYVLHVERMLDHHRFSCRLAVNHYGVRALGPSWSGLIAALREAAGRLPRPTVDAWDFAVAWLGPLDLGPAWTGGQAVRLPLTVTVFEHAGPVYLRVGQPPQRSELYCHDGETLVHVADERRVLPTTPLRDWHVRERWLLPCGGGSLVIAHEWQRPPRFVVHALDPERPIYVQRG